MSHEIVYVDIEKCRAPELTPDNFICVGGLYDGQRKETPRWCSTLWLADETPSFPDILVYQLVMEEGKEPFWQYKGIRDN